MLQEIVDSINCSQTSIDDGTLFCNNYTIVKMDFIDFLEEKSILINTLSTKQVGATVNLELSLPHLNSNGYYEDCAAFVLKNKYTHPSTSYYIEELKCFSSESNDFISRYCHVVKLIDAIKHISKHNYTDVDKDNSIIFREDRSLFLSFTYNHADIENISIENIDKLSTVTDTFEKDNSEKKLLYINELIDFLSKENESSRFEYLLRHISDFVDKSDNAYQYYIRNFSYNKLKAELDNSALDYSKKIQSIINDAQTKLIAIPVAFVLAASSIDWVDIFSIKNIVILFSLFIFATLIEIFLSNQSSSLAILKNNIQSYKASFGNNNQVVSDSFSSVDDEFIKQNNRLTLIRCITWGIPILLTLVFVVKSFITLSPLKFLLICFILTLPI
ncbi:hypothetical protein [Parabacteroides sp. Marseille-P3160]|uniref:hypothetical protein n=1 Tax=Parabacteroides sp. Marseille-P3160 TaxID=1917887 RepID=UPI0009BAAA14|nr:hypothetical protein [Parabacteroides sp. Marseille-P3160]